MNSQKNLSTSATSKSQDLQSRRMQQKRSRRMSSPTRSPAQENNATDDEKYQKFVERLEQPQKSKVPRLELSGSFISGNKTRTGRRNVAIRFDKPLDLNDFGADVKFDKNFDLQEFEALENGAHRAEAEKRKRLGRAFYAQVVVQPDRYRVPFPQYPFADPTALFLHYLSRA